MGELKDQPKENIQEVVQRDQERKRNSTRGYETRKTERVCHMLKDNSKKKVIRTGQRRYLERKQMRMFQDRPKNPVHRFVSSIKERRKASQESHRLISLMNRDVEVSSKTLADQIWQQIERMTQHHRVGFTPGPQGRFNIQESTTAIHQIHRLTAQTTRSSQQTQTELRPPGTAEERSLQILFPKPHTLKTGEMKLVCRKNPRAGIT